MAYQIDFTGTGVRIITLLMRMANLINTLWPSGHKGTVRCRRCGRKLQSKESIAAGIGQVCAQREDSGHVTKSKARRGKVEADPRQLAFDLRMSDESCPAKQPQIDVKELFASFVHGGREQ